MSNLEQLGLYIMVFVDKTFIDGNNLKKNINNHLPQLNQFTFYIHSIMRIRNEINLPSTDNIQHTFLDFPYGEIISYVDYFPEAKESRCHIYSYPSSVQCYSTVTNNFPGGLFEYVRVVSLFDENPFEHEFFLRIVQSCPFMEHLSLINHKPQKRRQSDESNDDNQNLPLIQFPFLIELFIFHVHDDYTEQFLLDTKTYLRNNVRLYIDYASLQRVTHNFTRDATRINCAKINKMHLKGRPQCLNSLQEYFPYAEMCPPFTF
jgi:hypothetical protein